MSSRRWNVPPHSRSVQYIEWLLSDKYTGWREGSLYGTEAWQTRLSRWWRLTSTVMSCRWYVPVTSCDENGALSLWSCLIFPKPTTLSNSWEKHQTNPSRNMFYTKFLASIPQNNQGKFEKLWQEAPKEKWLPTVMWHPRWNPGGEIGHKVKRKKIWIKYGLSWTTMHQYWFINYDKFTILM